MTRLHLHLLAWFGAWAVAGCQARDLVCETHENCANPSSEYCVEVSDVPREQCDSRYRAEETKCVSGARGELAGCHCIVGRAPRHIDGGVPALRTGLLCGDFGYDAGPPPDGGFDPGQELPGEATLFGFYLEPRIWRRIRTQESSDAQVRRTHLLGFETHTSSQAGATDRALVWVEYEIDGIVRYGLGDLSSAPVACEYEWNDVADTTWTPWVSFAQRPTQADVATFLEPPFAFGNDRSQLQAALRLDDRWRALLGFESPLSYAESVSREASLDCK